MGLASRVGLGLLVAAAASVVVAPEGAEGAAVLEVYLSGLDWPVALAFSPDGRIFFAERLTGAIRIVEDGVLRPTPFHTLADTATAGEQGLLGFALDPGFPATPYVYAYHTFRDAGNASVYNRIVRLRANGNAGSLDRVVLAGIPAAGIHNGGILGFGPDGKLYATDGDATNLAAAQDPMLLHGKVLRMNPDGTVPPDNPFAGNASANPYVYTYGHRNVFGLAFHPTTGRVFVTENGPQCNDEVNLLIPGRNYGWGPSQTCASPPAAPHNTNRDGPNPVLPLAWFGRPIAPTNVAVYGGPKFPAFQGDLIVGDWNTRSLRHLDLAPPGYDSVPSSSVVVTVSEGVLDVESGPDGAIWFTTPSAIYRYFDASQLPVASFVADPPSVMTGDIVVLNASASFDPNGTIVSYRWDFGDGFVGTGAVTSHAYDVPGTYTVTLTVADDESLANTASQQVVVRPRAPPSQEGETAPVAILAGSFLVAFVALAALAVWYRRRHRE